MAGMNGCAGLSPFVKCSEQAYVISAILSDRVECRLCIPDRFGEVLVVEQQPVQAQTRFEVLQFVICSWRQHASARGLDNCSLRQPAVTTRHSKLLEVYYSLVPGRAYDFAADAACTT